MTCAAMRKGGMEATNRYRAMKGRRPWRSLQRPTSGACSKRCAVSRESGVDLVVNSLARRPDKRAT